MPKKQLIPSRGTQERAELVSVLSNSLYPGASIQSVEMVLDYCAAGNLDPMQKPVHIVPMRCKVPGTQNNYEMRDTIMPGIGLYRIKADRTGKVVGMSEPEFGPMVESTFSGDKKNHEPDIVFKHPEWCKVVVKKQVGDVVADFPAKEYWIENYATKSAFSEFPNAMWKKRPMAQLAKCAEAQALRKAFPDIGQQATAEEMEGKIIYMGDAEVIIDDEPIKQKTRSQLPEYPEERLRECYPAWQESVIKGDTTPSRIINRLSVEFTLSDGQIEKIRGMYVPDVEEKTTPKENIDQGDDDLINVIDENY